MVSSKPTPPISESVPEVTLNSMRMYADGTPMLIWKTGERQPKGIWQVSSDEAQLELEISVTRSGTYHTSLVLSNKVNPHLVIPLTIVVDAPSTQWITLRRHLMIPDGDMLTQFEFLVETKSLAKMYIVTRKNTDLSTSASFSQSSEIPHESPALTLTPALRPASLNKETRASSTACAPTAVRVSAQDLIPSDQASYMQEENEHQVNQGTPPTCAPTITLPAVGESDSDNLTIASNLSSPGAPRYRIAISTVTYIREKKHHRLEEGASLTVFPGDLIQLNVNVLTKFGKTYGMTTAAPGLKIDLVKQIPVRKEADNCVFKQYFRIPTDSAVGTYEGKVTITTGLNRAPFQFWIIVKLRDMSMSNSSTPTPSVAPAPPVPPTPAPLNRDSSVSMVSSHHSVLSPTSAEPGDASGSVTNQSIATANKCPASKDHSLRASFRASIAAPDRGLFGSNATSSTIGDDNSLKRGIWLSSDKEVYLSITEGSVETVPTGVELEFVCELLTKAFPINLVIGCESLKFSKCSTATLKESRIYTRYEQIVVLPESTPAGAYLFNLSVMEPFGRSEQMPFTLKVDK